MLNQGKCDYVIKLNCLATVMHIGILRFLNVLKNSAISANECNLKFVQFKNTSLNLPWFC